MGNEQAESVMTDFNLHVAAWVDSWDISELDNTKSFPVNCLGNKLQECSGLIYI